MAHKPNIRNAFIKFTSAMVALITSDKSLFERLIAAFINFSHVNEDDLPDDLREDYDALHERVTALGIVNPNEGSIHATLREMSLFCPSVSFLGTRLE